MKLSAWIEKKLENPEFRNQYISEMDGEIMKLKSTLAERDATIEDQKQTIKCADNMTRCAYKNGDDDLAKAKDKWEKKLQSAKAENGRLVEALELDMDHGHDMSCQYGVDQTGMGDAICECSDICEKKNDALSSSNALDYWQGEVRKAKAEGMLDVRKFIKDWYKPNNQMKLLREQILERASHQSNPQSKGENLEPRGGG